MQVTTQLFYPSDIIAGVHTLSKLSPASAPAQSSQRVVAPTGPIELYGRCYTIWTMDDSSSKFKVQGSKSKVTHYVSRFTPSSIVHRPSSIVRRPSSIVRLHSRLTPSRPWHIILK